MNDQVIYLRLASGQSICTEFETCYKNSQKKVYHFVKGNASDDDIKKMKKFKPGSVHFLVCFVQNENKKENGSRIETIYLGRFIIPIVKYVPKNSLLDADLWLDKKLSWKRTVFECEGNKERDFCCAIENIIQLSLLNVKKDFQGRHVFIENSRIVAEQIGVAINASDQIRSKTALEKDLKGSHDSTEKLMMTDEQICADLKAFDRRRSSTVLKKSAEEYPEPYARLFDTDEDKDRPFRSDYEVITNSRAFRRMVDKAQVFSASKGDHYRTRMTHTQIVTQAARYIAEKLGGNVNVYLTEAIALGHDIGHTPFGHQGERTLDRILNDYADETGGRRYGIIRNIDMYKERNLLGGFKHNFQSVRVASLLENTYADKDGMNLTFLTLEGMLKHTKCPDKYNLSEFYPGDNAEKVLRRTKEYASDPKKGKYFCSTIEGQIVAAADEIAQRWHDLNDALNAGSITVEMLRNYFMVNNVKTLEALLDNAEKELSDAEITGRAFEDRYELLYDRISDGVYKFLRDDIIENSKENIKAENIGEYNYCVTKQLIGFSDGAKKVNDYLEDLIGTGVINSPEVSLFDSNAEIIVSGLFRAYYNNPRLMGKSALRRLFINTGRECSDVINFEYANFAIVNREIELITVKDLTTLKSELFDEYKDKRRILVRTICDYISGMTDSYAINEYNKLAKTYNA